MSIKPVFIIVALGLIAPLAIALALFVVLNAPVAQAQQQSACGPGQKEWEVNGVEQDMRQTGDVPASDCDVSSASLHESSPLCRVSDETVNFYCREWCGRQQNLSAGRVLQNCTHTQIDAFNRICRRSESSPTGFRGECTVRWWCTAILCVPEDYKGPGLPHTPPPPPPPPEPPPEPGGDEGSGGEGGSGGGFGRPPAWQEALFYLWFHMQRFRSLSLSSFDVVPQALSSTNDFIGAAQNLNIFLSGPFGPAAGQKSSGSLTAQVADSFFNGELTEKKAMRLVKELSENAGARTKLRELLGSLIGALTPLKTKLEQILKIGSSANLVEAQSLLTEAQGAAKEVSNYLTKLTRPSFLQRVVEAVGGSFGAKPAAPQVVNVTLQPVATEEFTIPQGVTQPIEAFTGEFRAITELLRLVFKLSVEQKTEVVVSAEIVNAETEEKLFEGSSKMLVIPGKEKRIKYIGIPGADDIYDGISVKFVKLMLFFTSNNAPIQLSVITPPFIWPPLFPIVIQKKGFEYVKPGILMSDKTLEDNACANARWLMEENGVPNKVVYSPFCVEESRPMKLGGGGREGICTITCVLPQ